MDGIVGELEKDPRVAAAYALWYQSREEVLRTYKDDLPERLPLSRQKEFKRIKNIVIEEAVRLDREACRRKVLFLTATRRTPRTRRRPLWRGARGTRRPGGF